MRTPLKHHGLWLLAWAAGALLGGWLLARQELARLHDAFDTDARIVHRLLSQRAVQHDAILATLALLRTEDATGNPEQRLPSVYPQILSVQRSDTHHRWTDPALQSAEVQSRRDGHAALARVDASTGRYQLVLAGTDSSYALGIDIRSMVPWSDWPMDAKSSPVQVALAYEKQEITLQAGQGLPASGNASGWSFSAQKVLASPSQPFVVVSRQAVGGSALPWGAMGAVALTWALLLAAARALVQQRQGRKRAEERLRMGQLTRLNTLGELAAGMAHELNQPLTAVLANTQAVHRMLADEHFELAEVQLALQKTVQQARRAADVVGRLRRTVERPGMASDAQTVNPMELARKALYLLEPEMQRSHITPQLQWVGEPFDVLADTVALEQILHNLLTNAMHALEHVPTERRTLQLLLEQSNRHGLVTVQDSGSGIPEDALPHVFEPFFTTREGGLGLGLSLCETLATSMGGTLTVRQVTQGQGGTAFCLSMPLAATQT